MKFKTEEEVLNNISRRELDIINRPRGDGNNLEEAMPYLKVGNDLLFLVSKDSFSSLDSSSKLLISAPT